MHYHRLDLALSHYDARGHLVVARRIIDSITPGWQQIGAVWLPLPHLLDALPVQIDAFYRNGASGVAISIAAFALAAASIVWIILTLTDSMPAALLGVAVFALNPNVLYLQATPMTEPLLLGTTTLAVALLLNWTNDGCRRGPAPAACGTGLQTSGPATGRRPGATNPGDTAEAAFSISSVPRGTTSAVGWAFALACLTRYEAWPVAASALAAAAWARWRRGDRWVDALGRVAWIALFPAVAIAAFFLFSRVVVGEWFVASGFFVPENKSLGLPVLAAAEVWWGVHMLSGQALVAIAAVGVGALLGVGLFDHRRGNALVVASLAALALLPWAAFVKGHPFRIRYMVPLMAIEAIGAGVAVALPFAYIEERFFRRRPQRPATSGWRSSIGRWPDPSSILRLAAAAALAVAIACELRPLDAKAPMVVEAQWDRPNQPARRRVTDCLRAGYTGDKIMASMGSLGHYMQEASRAGFNVSDFLHEGNGDIWLAALVTPRPFVGWVLIEEQAEGGDMLARAAREDPHFLDGFSRVCDGAGLALYRRQNR